MGFMFWFKFHIPRRTEITQPARSGHYRPDFPSGIREGFGGRSKGSGSNDRSIKANNSKSGEFFWISNCEL